VNLENIRNLKVFSFLILGILILVGFSLWLFRYPSDESSDEVAAIAGLIAVALVIIKHRESC
jgi:ABC-type transporter Mla subunit MlaD